MRRLGVGLLAALVISGCTPDATPPPRESAAPLPAPDPVLTAAAGRPLSPHSLPLAELDRLLTSGPLGAGPGAVVLDAQTGAVLYARDAQRARTPASVLKLLTGAAALVTLDPLARLRTRVVANDPTRLVLVGDGDTTLTAKPEPQAYPRRASLADLAAQTAKALRDKGISRVEVGYDDSRYAPPAVSPDWPESYVGSGVVAPVTALVPGAGKVFARLLGKQGIEVSGPVRRVPAATGAEELAAVESPTVPELVELMLATSDNDLAESLLRQIALATNGPATFADGTAAAVAAVQRLGVPTDGLVMLDGSGLARGSTVAPLTIARLLAMAAAPDSPQRLDHLVSGLAVGGFSGTLSLRYLDGPAAAAAGLVRAKTGTLTGVSTLAAVTVARGVPLVVVVMADRVPGDTDAARATLDRAVGLLTDG